MATTTNPYGTTPPSDLGFAEGDESGKRATARVQESLESVKQRASSMAESATRFIKERPTAALIGAVAAGFFIGRMASRR